MEKNNPQSHKLLKTIFEVLAAVCLIATITISIYNYEQLPEKIPSHYDGTGQPDAFRPKEILYSLPILSLALYVLLTIASRLDRYYNFPYQQTVATKHNQRANVKDMIIALKFILTMIFLYITYATIQTSLGSMQGLGVWFLPSMIVSIFFTIIFFLCRGYYLKSQDESVNKFQNTR